MTNFISQFYFIKTQFRVLIKGFETRCLTLQFNKPRPELLFFCFHNFPFRSAELQHTPSQMRLFEPDLISFAFNSLHGDKIVRPAQATTEPVSMVTGIFVTFNFFLTLIY